MISYKESWIERQEENRMKRQELIAESSLMPAKDLQILL